MRRAAWLLVVGLLALAGSASAATLDRIARDKVVRIAYRTDAPPFSYTSLQNKPAGLMVDLCQAVVRHLARQMQLTALDISYVVVTAANRFETIQQDKADLLCEPTSSTLARRKLVDFSVTTFVEGASLLIAPDGPQTIQALAGHSVGVLAGTTTEQKLRTTLQGAGIAATVVPAASHADGLAALDTGKVSAYFGDRSILLVLLANSKAPDRLRMANVNLSVETYALALPRGDDDFRLEVDRALSHIYGSGEIGALLKQTFGSTFEPGPILQTLYLVSGLPDQ